MPYFPFGFEMITGRAEDLKIATLVGTTVHERNDMVQGESFDSPTAHAHLRKRGPKPLAPTGFETATHFSKICIGRNATAGGTEISA